MTDTLQPLPSWMTYSSQVFTEPDGALSTSYSILQLPLTYYGPSIPLGPDWVYGGLTSPAPTTAPSTSTLTTTSPTITPPPPTTMSSSSSSATPTPISSTSAIPSSTFSSTAKPTSTSSASSITSATPPPTSSVASSRASSTFSSSSSAMPVPTAGSTSSGLSHNSIVAIICGAIAGFLILLVLLGLCLVLGRRSRRRRHGEPSASQPPGPGFFMRGVPISLSSVGSSYILIGAERTAGEGSPRHSGEEGDPFLQATAARRRAFGDDRSSDASTSRERASVWAIGPDGQRVHIRNSDGSEVGHDFGESSTGHGAFTDLDTTVVDDEASRFRAFTLADQERVKVAAARQIHSPGAAAAYAAAGQGPKMLSEKTMDDEELNEKMPLVPPQSYAGPDALGLQLLGLPGARSLSPHPPVSRSTTPYRNGPRMSNDSGVSLADPYTPTTFQFAHRVQMSDPRVPPAGSPPELRSAILGDPARTPEPERTHWLSPLTNNFNSFGLGGLGWLRREPSAITRPLTGTWLSRVPTPNRSFRSRDGSDEEEAGLLAPRAESPPAVPSATARSRGQLSVPSSTDRPVSDVSQRSKTSTVYYSAPESLHGDSASSGASAQWPVPPVPTIPAAVARPGRQSPPAPPAFLPSAYAAADVLDLPAPSPVPSFASNARARRPPHLQLPPGLPTELITTPRVWGDEEYTSSNGGLSPIASVSEGSDMLDAEPPRAADVWRSLADARARGPLAPSALPLVIHPVARQESCDASMHAGTRSSVSSSERSRPSPSHVTFARPMTQISSMGSTAPLIPRARDSTLTPQSSGASLAARSSGASSPASWMDRGFEGAASLSAFGPPQPGVFMSRNPYAPLSRPGPSGLASGSTIRVVEATPPGSEE